jgi:hypothetical protein
MRSKGIFPSRITGAVECSSSSSGVFFQAPELIRLFRVYVYCCVQHRIEGVTNNNTQRERGHTKARSMRDYPREHIAPSRRFSTSCFSILLI